eukprot:2900012-Amphidinium_carterae.1
MLRKDGVEAFDIADPEVAEEEDADMEACPWAFEVEQAAPADGNSRPTLRTAILTIQIQKH